MKNQKLAVIKNYDQNWLYIEVTGVFVTPPMYITMEKFSGLSSHLYILDFDKDGYLDIILPNFLTN
jgi:hypothetical protein